MLQLLQMCPPLSQEVWCPRLVQGPGGQAAADGADGCPHVCCVREDYCHDLQSDGPEKETEAMKHVPNGMQCCFNA